jgi:hypothetical protein
MLAAGVVLLAGCGGLTKSPAEGLTFTAPPGWTGTPGILGMAQVWTPPGDSKSVLMLIKAPAAAKLNESLESARVQDSSVKQQRTLTICTNQPARYLELTGKANGEDESIETVVTAVGDQHYVAMYMYPIASKPDPQAQAALRQICAKT